MSRTFLVFRLAARDLRRRRVEAVLMLVAIMAATTTLAMGLALQGVTSNPFQQTRAVTRGPDVVASYVDNPPMPRGAGPRAALAAMHALAGARGVAGHGGPYPLAWAVLRAGRVSAGVMAEGRDLGRATIDQPEVTEGSWIRPGVVVIERSFADALGVRAGERVTLNGRSFLVAGIAVAAGDAAYPIADYVTFGGPFSSPDCGMIWLIARRPRRAIATVASVTITVTLVVAVLTVQAHAAVVQQASGGFSALPNPRYVSVDRVLLVISVVMITLAAVNAIFVAWATALDARKSSALARALGATPGQVSMGLSVAQVLPAAPGVVLGIPLGIELVGAVGHGQAVTVPGVGWLVLVVLVVPLAVAGLTAIPARISARRSAAEILQGELA